MTDLTAKTNPEQASHAMHRELSQTEDDASLILSRVESLYEQGRYVDALATSQPLGPVTTWSSPAGRVMAGRLAGNLGAPRLGRALHWLAGRNDASHPAVLYYSAMAYWSRFGTLHAWRRYQAIEMPSDATATQKADWLALKATMLAWMRDFSRAEPLMIDQVAKDIKEQWAKYNITEVTLSPTSEGFEGTAKSSEGETFKITLKKDTAKKSVSGTGMGDRSSPHTGRCGVA